MPAKRKKVAILGSTGSIGINALKVIERFKDRFEVYVLSAHDNVQLLTLQAKQFKPRFVAIQSCHHEAVKKSFLARRTTIVNSQADLSQIVGLPEVDIVLLAISGRAALEPFLSAVKAGKHIAPANKEALMIAGDILMPLAKRYGAKIVPVDSEQSAIFQCLEGRDPKTLDKVILTASGGPLLYFNAGQMNRVTVEDILKHPRWDMGKKITVDSATMMNKGFEVIEAQRLFGLKTKQIDVLVHPQAIIHSMVQFKDHSIIAQLGVTDMRLPIQYALSHPARLDSVLAPVDFVKLKHLTFLAPDRKRFPCLGLAMTVAKEGGTLPAVLNAADEEAVGAFLNRGICFLSLFKIVDQVVAKHKKQSRLTIPVILDADRWAREETRKLIQKESL